MTESGLIKLGIISIILSGLVWIAYEAAVALSCTKEKKLPHETSERITLKGN